MSDDDARQDPRPASFGPPVPPPPSGAPVPAPPAAPPARPAAPRLPFWPLDDPLRLAVWALTAVGVLAVVSIVSGLFELELLGRLRDGGTGVLPSELTANDDRERIVSGLQLLALIVAAVCFIRWFHRAYSDLDALGVPRRHTTGCAIGAWVTPVLWWWRPKQIANELWAAGAVGGLDADPPPLLTAWWTVWLVGNWLGSFVGRRLLDETTVEGLIDADRLGVASDVLDIVGVGLAIAVARATTARITRAAAAA